jgi:hypothetical protein
MDRIIGLHITEGSFDTENFKLFISNLLDDMSPWPQPNSVVVMDNCQKHKHQVILKMIESRYVYLFVVSTNILRYRPVV